jgi:hypothetical protein
VTYSVNVPPPPAGPVWWAVMYTDESGRRSTCHCTSRTWFNAREIASMDLDVEAGKLNPICESEYIWPKDEFARVA